MLRIPFTKLKIARADADPPAKPSTPADAPPDPRLAAIDRIRETAKWLILAFAGLGGALAGQSLLSEIGSLDFGSGRLWLAICSAGVGLGAVAGVIWATANVLLPAQVTLPKLAANADLRALVDASPELLRGYGQTLEEFLTIYRDTIDEYAQAAARRREHPADPEVAADAKAKAEEVRALAPVVQRLVNQGLFEDVRSHFRQARWFIFAGAFLAGLSLIVVAWAANPDGDDAPAAGTPTTLPLSVVEVTLSPEGEARLASLLGCTERPFRAIVVGGTAPSPTIISLPEQGCDTVRLTLTSQLGTAVER